MGLTNYFVLTFILSDCLAPTAVTNPLIYDPQTMNHPHQTIHTTHATFAPPRRDVSDETTNRAVATTDKLHFSLRS